MGDNRNVVRDSINIFQKKAFMASAQGEIRAHLTKTNTTATHHFVLSERNYADHNTRGVE